MAPLSCFKTLHSFSSGASLILLTPRCVLILFHCTPIYKATLRGLTFGSIQVLFSSLLIIRKSIDMLLSYMLQCFYMQCFLMDDVCAGIRILVYNYIKFQIITVLYKIYILTAFLDILHAEI